MTFAILRGGAALAPLRVYLDGAANPEVGLTRALALGRYLAQTGLGAMVAAARQPAAAAAGYASRPPLPPAAATLLPPNSPAAASIDRATLRRSPRLQDRTRPRTYSGESPASWQVDTNGDPVG